MKGYNYDRAKYEDFVPTDKNPVPLHKQLAGDPVSAYKSPLKR